MASRKVTRTTQLRVEPLEARCVLSTFPNDPFLRRMYNLDVVQATEAWDLSTGDARVVVADIDTGIDYRHPDLYRNIWLNQGEVPRDIRSLLVDTDTDGIITFWDLNDPVNQGPGKISDLNGTGFIDAGDLLQAQAEGGWANGRDDDHNGYRDDLIGWDFYDNDNDPLDGDGHGTHIAGTIGAVGNNDVGVVGLNWKVQVMPLRFYPFTGPQLADPVPPIYYAVDHGARVSNHSYAASARDLPPALVSAGREAIAYAATKGHLVVAAAGNGGSNIDGQLVLPAAYDLPNIISVAATDKHDRLASFSNFGATDVDLGAPGVDVWSTYINPVGEYVRGFGTSMASPHVAGAAALLLSRNPGLSVAQLKAALLSTVDILPDLMGQSVSGGRLNLFRALQAVPAGSWSGASNSSGDSGRVKPASVGRGAFTPTAFPVGVNGAGPTRVVWSDVYDDDHAIPVPVRSGHDGTPIGAQGPGRASVLVGQGDETFAVAWASGGIPETFGLVVRDRDGDSDLDLATRIDGPLAVRLDICNR